MSEVQTALGKLIEGTGQRDAIHIAVAPVVAAVRLEPGQHIGFVAGDTETVAGHASAPLGIVDPFLKSSVQPGDRFWMFLYPNTITSLKHVWTHPAFGAEPARDTAASEEWLRELADHLDIGYRRLMDGARAHINCTSQWGEYLIGGDAMEGESTPEEFWDHYENVTGEKVPDGKRENFFSCAC